MVEESKPFTTWGANDRFAFDFGNNFSQAQLHFKNSRNDLGELVAAWDSIHEMYRMQKPYCASNELPELDLKDKKIETLLTELRSIKSQRDKSNNYLTVRQEVDDFFTLITDLAVKKGFFPKVGHSITESQKVKAMANR